MIRIALVFTALLAIAGCSVFDKYSGKNADKSPHKTETVRPVTSPETNDGVLVATRKIEKFFGQYNIHTIPRHNTVTICSAHGCQHTQKFRFSPEFLSELKQVMSTATDAKSEKSSIAAAIAMIETHVGGPTGTDKDKAWLSLFGSGDATQLDCTDEAINILQYLIVMNNNRLLRFHDIEGEAWRWSFSVPNHYGAVIKDKETGEKWVIDGNVGPNGSRPAIMPEKVWLKG